MFKVNNKDTRTTSVESFWYFCSKLWTYFTLFSSVSIVELDKANVSLVFFLTKTHLIKVQNSRAKNNFEISNFQMIFPKIAPITKLNL